MNFSHPLSEMRIISADKPGRWLVGQGNDLLINELDKMLKAKLIV